MAIAARSPTPASSALLHDGSAITIRPIRASDLELERAFVRGLSRETRYQRLHSARDLRPGELERMTNIDPDREAALIATTEVDGAEQEVGVARYARDDETGEYEFAIVIADAWQGRGLGERLMCELIRTAEAAGVPALTGIVQSTNDAMLHLARKFGFRAWHDPDTAFITQLRKPLGAGNDDAAGAPARRYYNSCSWRHAA